MLRRRKQDLQGPKGFSLIELMVALAVFLGVSAVVLSLAYRMGVNQAGVANRSDMHASIRSVTELLQQEISQAGRITWPSVSGTGTCPSSPIGDCPYITMTNAVTVVSPNTSVTATMNVSDSSVIFPGERLIIDVGCSNANDHTQPCEEVIIVPTSYTSGTTINNVVFAYSHAANAQLRPAGAFMEGILIDGSTATPGAPSNVLHMFGDINDDGNMVYVRYTCAPGTITNPGTLTRQQVSWDGTGGTQTQVLLNNLLPNPDGSDVGTADDPCFSFQFVRSQSNMNGYNCVGGNVGPNNCTSVLNVAVTLTARTELPDPETRSFSENTKETKALLSVSPRNLFEAWQLSQMPSGVDVPGQISGPLAHVQPTPSTILTLYGTNTTGALP